MVRTVLLLFAAAAPALAQLPPADAARLFPEASLAYAELRDPAAVAEVVTGWAAKTPFADGLAHLWDRKDAAKEHRLLTGLPAVAWAGLLASPEMLGELKHLPGAGVAVVGFGPNHEPRWAGAVLLGGRPLPHFAVRHWLATESFRRVATAHGVPVVQYRGFAAPGNDDAGRPLPLDNPKPTVGPHEFTAAFAPGILAVGSDVAAVADVLGRFNGKVAEKSLADTPRFKALAAERTKPGSFAFVAVADLHAKLTAAQKAGRVVVDTAALANITFLLNPAATPTVAVTLAVAADDIRLSLIAPKAGPSPFGKLFAAAPVPVPQVPGAALTLSSAASAADVLAVADALANAVGEVGKLPSDRVAAAEFPDVRGIGIIVSETPEPNRGAVFVLPCTTPEAADALLAKVPALAGAAESAEIVGALKVRTVLTPNGQFHYARGGAAAVFGFDRAAVATAGTAPTSPAKVLNLAALFGARPPETFKGPPAPEHLAFAVLEPFPPATVAASGGIGWRVDVGLKGFAARLPAASAKAAAWLETRGAGVNPNPQPPGIIDR